MKITFEDPDSFSKDQKSRLSDIANALNRLTGDSLTEAVVSGGNSKYEEIKLIKDGNTIFVIGAYAGGAYEGGSYDGAYLDLETDL
jgi:hypothetical protein